MVHQQQFIDSFFLSFCNFQHIINFQYNCIIRICKVPSEDTLPHKNTPRVIDEKDIFAPTYVSHNLKIKAPKPASAGFRGLYSVSIRVVGIAYRIGEQRNHKAVSFSLVT